MHKASQMDLNFSMYFEPEGGINTPREFTDEIIAWANKEGKYLGYKWVYLYENK